MHRVNSYPHPYPPAMMARYSTTHSTSSAFSPNANPNEDWTKISDLAERRRIQNRIAQRNYRKKLKRRLEDLERRAASTPGSSEQPHGQVEKARRGRPEKIRSQERLASPRLNSNWNVSPPGAAPQSESAVNQDQQHPTLFSQQCTRQLSASPPPVFSYSSYPHVPYPAVYSPPPPPSNEVPMSAHFLDTVPVTLPALATPVPTVKQEPFVNSPMFDSLGMGYAPYPPMELSSTSQPHQQSHFQQTPPLYSYDHSGSTSPDGSMSAFPITPEPAQCSPHPVGYY